MNMEDRNKKALRACWGVVVAGLTIIVALFSLFMVNGATGSAPAAVCTFVCIEAAGAYLVYKIVKGKKQSK